MNVLKNLAFSPFEWSMSDRVSASPMEFVFRLDCVGVVDEANFSKAISAELKRQPLLQANATVGQTHRDSHWRPASNTTPTICWYEGDPAQGSGFPEDFVPIDLENEIGFRFYGWHFVVNGQDCIVMKFVYHHACCDGKGATDFIENTLHRYQCLMGDKTDSLSDLAAVDEEQLRNRNLPAVSKLSLFDRIWRAIVIRPRRVGNMLLSKPRAFSKSTSIQNGSDGDIYSDPPKHCSKEFSEGETKQLGAYAKRLSVSTNSVLASELFHTLNEHLESNSKSDNDEDAETLESEAESSKRALRILVPFSLRDERHHRMPAANCVSIAYLEATRKNLLDDSASNPVLVSDLENQMDFIRRWRLQYSWIESINSYARIWPIIRLLGFRSNGRSKNVMPIATTIMTNLGRVFSNGKLIDSNGEMAVKDLVVKSFHVSPPCNTNVIVNFSVNFYRNRLTLDASYLSSLLTRETAEGLLDSWKRRILGSVSGSSVDL